MDAKGLNLIKKMLIEIKRLAQLYKCFEDVSHIGKIKVKNRGPISPCYLNLKDSTIVSREQGHTQTFIWDDLSQK